MTGADLRRRLADCLVDGLLQFHNPCRDMIHLIDVIGQRYFQRRFLKANVALDPLPVLLGPRFDSLRPLPAVPQEKLSEPMTGFQLVLLGGFPRSHQIPQGLLRSAGHTDCRQFSSAVASRQLFRIPPVGFDAIPGFGRHQARRDHLTGHAKLVSCQYSTYPVGASLVAGPQLLDLAEFVNQIFRIDSKRFGITPSERTSPPCSATATAIVSAWTSRPTNSTLDMSDQFLSYAALRRWIHLFAA
jgi:hypothetical protein